MLIAWLLAVFFGLGSDYAAPTLAAPDDPGLVQAMDDGTPQPPPKK